MVNVEVVKVMESNQLVWMNARMDR
jgi:hypothetical protein